MNDKIILKYALVGLGLILLYILFIYLPQQQQIFNTKLIQVEKLVNQASSTINKSKNQNTLPITNTFASVIAKWESRVGQIGCNFRNANGYIYQMSLGSATLINNRIYANQYGVLTNLHVLEYQNSLATDCYAKFPNNPNLINITSVTDSLVKANNSIDAAVLVIKNPDSYVINFPYNEVGMCKHEPVIGDQIVILGYPGIGSDRSVTATDGIISGIENNDYVTSAKVEHGNSGGIAISVKSDCAIGIPTFVETGSLESLARILKWQTISLVQ